MKNLMVLMMFLFSTLSLAETPANYTVREGKLHKGGTLQVSVLPNTEVYRVQMDYEIFKRAWVPVPPEYLKGTDSFDLPNEFRDERGYLELEHVGSMEVDKAKIVFLRRVDIGIWKNCYEAEIIPSNNKSRIKLTYHPQVPSAGILKVELTFISKVPLLNGYQLIADLKEQ